MARFDVTRITVNIAGTQTFTIDAHLTTRPDRATTEMIAVTVGNMLIQVHDLPAAQAFSTAAQAALGYVPARFPARTVGPEIIGTRECPGVVLQVEGAPTVNRVHGFGSGYGAPHVRIHLDRLSVRFFDTAALESWVAGWSEVERLALRLWPAPDAFEAAEDRERRRTARRGSGSTSSDQG